VDRESLYRAAAQGGRGLPVQIPDSLEGASLGQILKVAQIPEHGMDKRRIRMDVERSQGSIHPVNHSHPFHDRLQLQTFYAGVLLQAAAYPNTGIRYAQVPTATSSR